MKKLVLLMALLSQAALADTFTYELHYNEEKTEEIGIKIEVELTGKFVEGSKVKSFKIFGEDDGKMILLFNIPGKNLEAKWNSAKVLEISTITTVLPLVKEEYIPYHSDTWIKPGEEFSFEQLKLDANGSPSNDEDGFYLGNQTVEEMGLSGFFKRVK